MDSQTARSCKYDIHMSKHMTCMQMYIYDIHRLHMNITCTYVLFMYICIKYRSYLCIYQYMGWLRLVGLLKLQVSFAKEPYKRD